MPTVADWRRIAPLRPSRVNPGSLAEESIGAPSMRRPLPRPSGVVDRSAALRVQREHRVRLVAQEVTHDPDPALFEVSKGCREHRAFLEMDTHGVIAPSAAGELPYATPEHGAQAHRARLTRGNKLALRQ